MRGGAAARQDGPDAAPLRTGAADTVHLPRRGDLTLRAHGGTVDAGSAPYLDYRPVTAEERAGLADVIAAPWLSGRVEDRAAKKMPVLAAEWLASRFSDVEFFQSEEDLAWATRLRIGRF